MRSFFLLIHFNLRRFKAVIFKAAKRYRCFFGTASNFLNLSVWPQDNPASSAHGSAAHIVMQDESWAAQRCSELRPGLQKKFVKNLLLILCILMHVCNARCFNSTRSGCFILQLAEWPVIFSYNMPIKCHNITSKVQWWQCSKEKVKPAKVSLSRSMFNLGTWMLETSDSDNCNPI